jgi:glycosyltransferase involved in cell wall biosynthesis
MWETGNSNDVDGLKQVVEGAGLLFKVGDYKALSRMVKELIDNKSQYDLKAEKSIKRAEEYSVEKTTNKYIKTYKEMLQ